MGKLSAGSYDLNRWLYGGYEEGVITTLYGGAGSGKTNFSLLTAVSQAKKGEKVIFIDTEGGFSSERAKQIIGVKSGKDDESNFEKIMENILILKPTNFKEQKEVFDELHKHLKKQVRLIVVDGMTMLYRLDFANARDKRNGEGDFAWMHGVNSELTRQMQILAEIARKHEIAVIVTNQTYNWNDESRMVGGDIMKYWSKCLIELINESGKRTAYLRKHRSLKESSLAFQITDEGIKKRGWI